MKNYLLILDGKTIKSYKSLKCAMKAYERLLVEKEERQNLELFSREDGLIKESF